MLGQEDEIAKKLAAIIKESVKEQQPKPEQKKEPKPEPVQRHKRYLYQEGKDIIKELPLSKIEPFILAIASMAALVMFFLERMAILTFGGTTGILVLLIVVWGLFAYKYMFFFPRGKKYIVIRGFQNSGLMFSVEKPHDGLVHFDKDDTVPPTQISRINKHFEVSTGRPCVVALEGITDNLNLMEQFAPTREAKEFNNIIKTTWGTAWQACLNNMLRFSNKIKEPMFIITIIVLIAIIAVIVLQFTTIGTLQQMIETLEGIAVPAVE